jgi:signal peptidase I
MENVERALLLLVVLISVIASLILSFGPAIIAIRAAATKSRKLTIIALNVTGVVGAWLILLVPAATQSEQTAANALIAVFALPFWIFSLVLALRTKRGVWIKAGSVALCLVIGIVAIRTFLVQTFDMPSSSDAPTLLVGDYFFVSKYSYGAFGAQPQRGDMVVFGLPKDISIKYAKRIVGLPGDRIQMIGGVLTINGQPVRRERTEDFITEDDGVVQRIKQYRETMPNSVTYNTLDLTENGFYDNTPPYTVPPGHYFMMGDNRDNSTDSRALN